MSREKDYEIGHGKPPQASQYKAGQSGNPKGRPKKNIYSSFAEDLFKELQSPVTYTENGKVKKITKQQALAKSCIKKASEGNTHVLNIMKELKVFDPNASTRPFRMTSTALRLIEEVEKDILNIEHEESQWPVAK